MVDTNQEYQLLDFAEEILMNIFNFFDDCTLLESTRVCRRFKAIAEVATSDKYNGNHEHNYYKLEEYADDAVDQRAQHLLFFTTFANHIKAVSISFYHQEVEFYNWMFELIIEYCPNVLKLILGHFTHPSNKWIVSHLEHIISRLPKLQSLQFNNIDLNDSRWSEYSCPTLTEIVFNQVNILDLQTLKQFLVNNRQLESFKCNQLNHVNFAVFDGSNLKELIQTDLSKYEVSYSPEASAFFEDSSHVQMEMLKTILVRNPSIDLFEKLATGCVNIETLAVCTMMDFIELTETQMNALLTLKQISSLKLQGVRVSTEQMKELITQSPSLIKLDCTCADEISIDDVKDIILHAKDHCELDEILLRSTFENMKPSKLGMKFHNWFKNNAKSNFQFRLLKKVGSVGPAVNEFIVTNEKITRNGALILWNDYKQSLNDPGQSDANFLQLNDKCSEKIIEYLNEFDKLALYQTCNRMQKLIEPMFQKKYANNSFYLRCDSAKTEYFIRYFGKYMTNITFGSDRRCINIDGRCSFHWELIHKYCYAALTNLTVQHSSIMQHILHIDEDHISFPNLKKLKFQVPINHVPRLTGFDDVDLIYSFCPNLEQLEFGNGIALMRSVDTYFDDGLSNLTTLRIERYTSWWIEFLQALNDDAHHNLCDLTLQNLCDVVNGRLRYQLDNAIVNEIVQFPNLKSLDLLLGAYQNANTKYLFENCSKLEALSITMGSSIPHQLFGLIKKICNKLETLKIVVKRNQSLTGLLHLNNVRKYFPPQLNIKVYEAFDGGYVTKGFILDEEWLADFEKFRTSVHD